MYNFVTELLHLLSDVFANYTFWHNKYELSLTIDIGLLHMYHLSVFPPKQHKIPLIVFRQISTPNVYPNLTDAQVSTLLDHVVQKVKTNPSQPASMVSYFYACITGSRILQHDAELPLFG